jgi:DNA-binding NarL/FixJ family response regulator
MVAEHPDMEVVGEAADGSTAYGAILEVLPDVAVLDLTMPGLNGFQTTQRLTRDCPSVKVLALTVHDESGYVHQLLKAGAKGYVLKRSAGVGLIQALQVVAAGGVYLDPAIAGKLVSKIGRPQRAIGEVLTEIELSERESEVVRQTAAGYGNKEIASRLDLSVKTVETYRARAMEKLGIANRVELVRYVRMRGWFADD